jgi:hypothetical protein
VLQAVTDALLSPRSCESCIHLPSPLPSSTATAAPAACTLRQTRSSRCSLASLAYTSSLLSCIRHCHCRSCVSEHHSRVSICTFVPPVKQVKCTWKRRRCSLCVAWHAMRACQICYKLQAHSKVNTDTPHYCQASMREHYT